MQHHGKQVAKQLHRANLMAKKANLHDLADGLLKTANDIMLINGQPQSANLLLNMEWPDTEAEVS